MKHAGAANITVSGAREAVVYSPPISIVVPCHNEADGIAELHRRVVAVCQTTIGDGFEVVLVNDGSTDATWPLIRTLAASDDHVIGVNLSRNHGHQLALSAGLTICRGERVLVIDADLQDPPELLPEMMRLMDGGADVVYGQRRTRSGETWLKTTTASWFYRLLDKFTDFNIPRDTGDFRLLSRRALDVLLQMPEQHRFIRGMVSWIGFNQVPLLYDRNPRFAGTTHYPFTKMLRFAIDAVTGFSIRPLRIASYLGIAFGFIGAALLIYTAVGIMLHRTVEGWASLMATVVILGSTQLLMLGVIGEYIGRIYTEAKRRPLFVIESVVRKSDPGRTSQRETDLMNGSRQLDNLDA
jgi:polyisoprenyl-phosphate glycosyltransferase